MGFSFTVIWMFRNLRPLWSFVLWVNLTTNLANGIGICSEWHMHPVADAIELPRKIDDCSDFLNVIDFILGVIRCRRKELSLCVGVTTTHRWCASCAARQVRHPITCLLYCTDMHRDVGLSATLKLRGWYGKAKLLYICIYTGPLSYLCPTCVWQVCDTCKSCVWPLTSSMSIPYVYKDTTLTQKPGGHVKWIAR